jgi:hypothetical protein
MDILPSSSGVHLASTPTMEAANSSGLQPDCTTSHLNVQQSSQPSSTESQIQVSYRQGPVASAYEYRRETSSTIKCREVLYT